jgi:transposase-like protein
MMVMKGWRDVLLKVREARRPRRSVIGLRTNFDAESVRWFAEELMDRPEARRRLLAVAAILDGATRMEAAKIAGVTAQTVRDWVKRFNVDGVDGLINFKLAGQPSRSPRKRDPEVALRRMLTRWFGAIESCARPEKRGRSRQ